MPSWTKKNFQRLRDRSPRDAPPAVIRSFEAGPDGLDLICIGGRKPKGGDTERVADVWG